MDRRTRWILGGTLCLVVIGGGAGLAVATNGAVDEPIPRSDLDEAVAAALEHTGGGTVIETEAGDDGAAFSVEILLEDGSRVEVNLDERFSVVGQEADDDGSTDRNESGDD